MGEKEGSGIEDFDTAIFVDGGNDVIPIAKTPAGCFPLEVIADGKHYVAAFRVKLGKG